MCCRRRDAAEVEALRGSLTLHRHRSQSIVACRVSHQPNYRFTERRARALIGAAFLSLLVGTASGHARQDPEHERLREGLQRYSDVVERYRRGDDATPKEIRGWDSKRLSEIVVAAQRSTDVSRVEDLARIKAAIMLHTNAAIEVLEIDEQRVVFQLQLAELLLQKSGGTPLHSFATKWYVTVSRVLRNRALLLVAESFLEHGRQNLPRDAALLYESGVLQEQIATYAASIADESTPARAFESAPQSVWQTGPRLGTRSVALWRSSLDKASRWLQAVIAADPSNDLARLHLGRVHALRGNHDEASALLKPLASGTAGIDTLYLATMFLGAMEQRRGRNDEAERMYRQAMARVPTAQSAYVALSELLQKSGRGDQARQVLTGMLRQPADVRSEPWWWYLAEAPEDVRRLADELANSVRK